MPLLNTADAIYLGPNAVDRIYLGEDLIWPASSATQYAAVRLVGNVQWARSPTIALGGSNPNGATNFEIQGLVYIEGAYTSEDRIFMVQFPASRQAGVFVSNLFPGTPGIVLVTGDSQVGSTGGTFDGGVTRTGVWCFITFSADTTPATAGFWRGTIEALDGSFAFSAGGRTKGVETSLQGNRVDLNGGGVDNGWANGIRYAHVRAYNAQRSDAQRQIDKTRKVPEGGELFWWDFVSDGGGGVTTNDLTGNGRVPTLNGATLGVGPLF